MMVLVKTGGDGIDYAHQTFAACIVLFGNCVDCHVKVSGNVDMFLKICFYQWMLVGVYSTTSMLKGVGLLSFVFCWNCLVCHANKGEFFHFFLIEILLFFDV